MINLTRLDPTWIRRDGRIVGVRFKCPTCSRWGANFEGIHSVGVLFTNPPDGGPALPNDETIASNNDGQRWTRTGDTFESLTLTPSIDGGEGEWHGYVQAGIVT